MVPTIVSKRQVHDHGDAVGEDMFGKEGADFVGIAAADERTAYHTFDRMENTGQGEMDQHAVDAIRRSFLSSRKSRRPWKFGAHGVPRRWVRQVRLPPTKGPEAFPS